MALDRIVRVSRTGRQVPALTAGQARERELVEADQRMSEAARRPNQRGHVAGAASRAASRAPIWVNASTTASNVNNVEAWRAL
jgi:hypothetical protein